jgi:hypothetical protein
MREMLLMHFKCTSQPDPREGFDCPSLTKAASEVASTKLSYIISLIPVSSCVQENGVKAFHFLH